MNHKKCQKIHFRNRWKERTGEEITNTEYQEILGKMKTEAIMLYRASDGGNNSIYRLKHNGAFLKICYDPFQHVLVSLLP